jgi:hypothetical protein
MKITRYYCNGVEITAKRAEEIERDNQHYMNSGNFEDLLKCKFIEEITEIYNPVLMQMGVCKNKH